MAQFSEPFKHFFMGFAMSIGQRIKEERERLKLSQTSFGEIGGMGKTTVQAWERGSAFPNAAFLERAATFGVDVLYVITGQRHENTATTPLEMSYLRICRALPTLEAKKAGNAALKGVLDAYGVKLPAAGKEQGDKK